MTHHRRIKGRFPTESQSAPSENDAHDDDPWGNPRVIGPGIWSLYYQRALAAQTREQRELLYRVMQLEAASFPCSTCGAHYRQALIDVGDPERYLKETGNTKKIDDEGNTLHIGMFMLVYDVMKRADGHTGKTTPDWRSVLSRVLKLRKCSNPVCMYA